MFRTQSARAIGCAIAEARLSLSASSWSAAARAPSSSAPCSACSPSTFASGSACTRPRPPCAWATASTPPSTCETRPIRMPREISLLGPWPGQRRRSEIDGRRPLCTRNLVCTRAGARAAAPCARYFCGHLHRCLKSARAPQVYERAAALLGRELSARPRAVCERVRRPARAHGGRAGAASGCVHEHGSACQSTRAPRTRA
eukprot:506644-Pleurochrysis_carterae.AAC.1